MALSPLPYPSPGLLDDSLRLGRFVDGGFGRASAREAEISSMTPVWSQRIQERNDLSLMSLLSIWMLREEQSRSLNLWYSSLSGFWILSILKKTLVVGDFSLALLKFTSTPIMVQNSQKPFALAVRWLFSASPNRLKILDSSLPPLISIDRSGRTVFPIFSDM